ncbi:MAG: hypothetical protein IJB28_08940, partial [Bacteroidaceae bacterium]|nr:hypothetical protein [Bacteroidaceae bacterium]
RNKFLEILESFSNVKDAIGNLNKYDDWYDEDVNTRWESLDMFDKDYYSFKDDWAEYFEEYLFKLKLVGERKNHKELAFFASTCRDDKAKDNEINIILK